MRVTFPTRSPLRALPCPKWGLNAIGQCQRYHIRTFEKTPDASSYATELDESKE
ncbi:hypothetical protein E4U47_001944, partial [Claviceps purpurea]